MDRPGAKPYPIEVDNWIDKHNVDKATLLSRPAGGVYMMKQPRLDVASSEIRAMIAEGRDPRFLIPPSVMEYIRRHGLFSPKDA